MYTPLVMSFYSSSVCNLTCNFCPRSAADYVEPKVYMNMETFKRFVDMSVAYGITTMELTPMIGEALLDPHIVERIRYVQAIESVEKIIIFTNCTRVTDEFIEAIKDCTKVAFTVSLYGIDEKSFNERTDSTQFNAFYQSFYKLVTHVLNSVEDTFYIHQLSVRVPGVTSSRIIKLEDPTPTLLLAHMLYKAGLMPPENIFDVAFDINWKDGLLHVEETIEEDTYGENVHNSNGVCEFFLYDIGVWPNGDIGVCANWFDFNKKMILGNLNETTFEELFKAGGQYDELLQNQRNGEYKSLCKHCSYNKQASLNEIGDDVEDLIKEMIR